MKLVHTCLNAREDRESSFHRSGGPVMLAQPCRCAGNADKVVLTSEEVL